jgi:hypothetical protein
VAREPILRLNERDFLRARVEMLRDLTGMEPEQEPLPEDADRSHAESARPVLTALLGALASR